MRAFLDTNILIYSVSRTPSEFPKRDRARELIAAENCAVSVQVLQEFFAQITRPTRKTPLSSAEALGLIATWRRFPVQETTLALLDYGFEIMSRHRFSFWDSMIVAAAKAQSCSVLWTEDMDNGRIIDGMRIANPFA